MVGQRTFDIWAHWEVSEDLSQGEGALRPIEECLRHYYYSDAREVQLGVNSKVTPSGLWDEETKLAFNRYKSLIEQGAFFKTLGRVNWRVVPEAPPVSIRFLEYLKGTGELVDRFLCAVERSLVVSEYVRRLVGFPACAEETLLIELERGRPLHMLRLDLVMERGSVPRLVEIQVVMGGLGIAQALRVAYGKHSILPGIAQCYEDTLEQLGGKMKVPKVVAMLGGKASPYRHEHLCLARHLRGWIGIVAPSRLLGQAEDGGIRIGDEKVKVIHRLFRSPGAFKTPWGHKLLEAMRMGEILLLNPWKDFLEDKRILALIHDPEAQRILEKDLSQGDRHALEELVPKTRLLTPELVGELISLPRDSRDMYLKKGRSKESKKLFHGRQMSSRKWDSVCRRLAREGDWIIQEGVKAFPRRWRYLDPATGVIKKMDGYLRVCPYFFRARDGRLRLAEVLITAREQSSRIHGASDAILTVVGDQSRDEGKASLWGPPLGDCS